MAKSGALEKLDLDMCIDRLSNGQMLKQIAAEYGVSKVAIYKRVRKHPDYKDAIASQSHSFVEDALEAVMGCDANTVNIARAQFDAAYKYAKAHNPDYADKSQIEVTHVDLGERLRRAKERVIDGERVAQTPNGALLPPIDADCKDESDT